MEPEFPEFESITGEITGLLCGCIVIETPEEQVIFVDMEWCQCGHFAVAATFDDEGFNDGQINI